MGAPRDSAGALLAWPKGRPGGTVPEMPALLRFASRRPTLGIDLGTAFVRVSTPTAPVAVEHPVDDPTGRRWGRPPAMREGVVHDIDAAGDVLGTALREAPVRDARRARMLVSVPATATPVERQGVRWALHAAGVRSTDVVLIEEPVAAAVGLGLDIADERPRLVVDIGHGISEAAVIAAGGIRVIRGVRVGCAALAGPDRHHRAAVVHAVERMVLDAIAQLRPDEAASLDGLHLVGGGSLDAEVRRRLSASTGLEVHHAVHAVHAVARGDAACALETFQARRRR